MLRIPVLVTMSVAILGCACALTSCERGTEREPGPRRIVATIPPFAWVARTVAPDAQVTMLVPAGATPHGFELTPSNVLAISKADVIVYGGMGLSPSLERAVGSHAPKGTAMVDCSGEAFSPLWIETSGGHHHHHDHGHDHHHDHDHAHASAVDPHIWLDVDAMERLGETLAARLAQQTGETYEAGLERLRAELGALRDELAELKGDIEGATMVTHHDAYAYLARPLGIEVAAVIRPIESVEPTPGEIARVVEVIREQGIGAIFIEPQFSALGAQRIANETGCEVLELDPLGDGDYPAMMRKNIASLRDGLSQPDAGDGG